MLIFAVIAVFGGLALIGWLVFNLAAYALPVLVGVFAARELHALGAEWLLAVPGGVLAGILTFAVGQLSVLFLKPMWAKILVVAAFVTPAAVTGYYAGYGLSEMISQGPITRTVFGVVGAIIIAATAFKRLITPPPALSEGASAAYAG